MDITKNSQDAKNTIDDKYLNILIKGAKDGDPVCQLNYGRMLYSKNSGVKLNPQEAIYWFNRAAEGGLASAKAQIAVVLASGVYVKQDFKKSFEMLVDAEKLGDKSVLYYIGLAHMKGFGVEINTDIGIDYFKKGKDVGCVNSHFALGAEYLRGKFIEQDIKLGMKLIEHAAKQNHVEAQHFLFSAYDKNGIVDRSPVDAIYWLKEAVKNNHLDSVYELGRRYEEGIGVQEDLKKAYEYYMNASARNHPKAVKKILDLSIRRETISSGFPVTREVISHAVKQYAATKKYESEKKPTLKKLIESFENSNDKSLN